MEGGQSKCSWARHYSDTCVNSRGNQYDQDMSITDAFGLMVGVSAQPASFLGSTTELPPWRRCELFPGATAGKIGEPSEQNREELNF